MWVKILNTFNQYGGLIGFVSLGFSVIIWVITGNIKKTIIQNRQLKEYRNDKQTAVQHLNEIAASIELDQLYDNKMKTELLVELNKLLKYKGFIDWKCRYYIFRINHLLDKASITSKNSNEIVTCLAKLCGRMYVEPVDTEMR